MTADSLLDSLLGQDVLEWLGLISGILYVVAATYERPVAWWFGLAGSLCLGWKSFVDYKLIADGLLQVAYVIMSIAGLLAWYGGRLPDAPKPIRVFPWRVHLAGMAIALAVAWPVARVLIHYAGARYGYPDTALMMLSLWATILLVRKDLHQWIYWIVIDAAYVWLYWQTKAWLFALLFLVYGLVAVWGWRRWSREYHQRNLTMPGELMP